MIFGDFLLEIIQIMELIYQLELFFLDLFHFFVCYSKYLEDFLPSNFHFFSLWIFICIFLQSFISYLIIYNKTKNFTFSVIGSLFFLISPVFISQIMFHMALAGQWLILLAFYIEIKNTPSKKDILLDNINIIICVNSFLFYNYFIRNVLLIHFQ